MSQPTAQFIPRRHPLELLIKANERAADLVHSVIPDYARLAATADRANDMSSECGAEIVMTTPNSQPHNLAKLDEWLDAEISRRIRAQDLELRIQVLRELGYQARTESHRLLDEHVDDCLEALAGQLGTWLSMTSEAVRELGDGINSAAAAIDAGAAAAWKKISDGLPEYRDIRTVQVGLYTGASWPFDRAACGDSNRVDDLEARLYFHRRLPDIAPHWMTDPAVLDSFGQSTADRSMPWPVEPVERMVWCIRNDSGIWCPTIEQISAAAKAPVRPRNPGPNERKFQGLMRGKSERQLLNPRAVSGLR